MAYLKQETTEKVLVRPEFNDNKSLHGTWSSYDKNVHKVVIPVIPQTGLGFDMTEIVSVQVYLKFANGAYGPFAGQIEDHEQRTVSFTVPEEVRGQTGTVSVSVMLNLTEDRQIDLVRFTATARISAVDSDAPEMQKYYLPMYEDLVADIQTRKTLILPITWKIRIKTFPDWYSYSWVLMICSTIQQMNKL